MGGKKTKPKLLLSSKKNQVRPAALFADLCVLNSFPPALAGAMPQSVRLEKIRQELEARNAQRQEKIDAMVVAHERK